MDHDAFISALEEVLEVEPGTVHDDDDLVELGWDSLSALGLIATLDTRFGLTVEAGRLLDAGTPSALWQLVDDSREA